MKEILISWKLISSMNDYNLLNNLNLVIIGSGTWGKKLFKIFELQVANCFLISARDFLQKPMNLEVSNQNFIYWIATRPSFQIAILDRLTERQVDKVIIEKPYFVNSEEFFKLNYLLGKSFHTSVFLSEPWLHSALWNASSAEILDLHSNSEKIKISIYRVSGEQRDFICSIQDWMPHDVSLLFDLMERLDVCELELLSTPVIKENLMKGSLQLGKKINVDFAIGYSAGLRTGKWLIRNESGFIDIDFVGLRLESKIMGKNILRTDYGQDSPLINQLRWISSQVSDSNVINKLNLQKEFLH